MLFYALIFLLVIMAVIGLSGIASIDFRHPRIKITFYVFFIVLVFSLFFAIIFFL